jgi:hypothetical protein
VLALHYFLRGMVAAQMVSGVGQTMWVHRARRRGGTSGAREPGCGTGLECQRREISHGSTKQSH